jgi:hypothetical protein
MSRDDSARARRFSREKGTSHVFLPSGGEAELPLRPKQLLSLLHHGALACGSAGYRDIGKELWNLATRDIEGFFDIKCSTFDIESLLLSTSPASISKLPKNLNLIEGTHY